MTARRLRRLRRLGWTLALLGVVLIPATVHTWYVLATSGVLWVAAVLVSEGYRDSVQTASDLIAAERARG